MQSSGIIYYYHWDYQPGMGSPAASSPPTAEASLLTNFRGRGNLSKSTASPSQVRHSGSWSRVIGLGLMALALGGLSGPLIPRVRLEAKYAALRARALTQQINSVTIQQFNNITLRLHSGQAMLHTNKPATQVSFSPLTTPDGASIDPVDTDFGLVIPKIGVNAAVIPAVNPTKPGQYLKALEKGIAHSSLSYFPDEDGTVYLFSHSTNYDWFVGDLNAVFYLLKNLEEGDLIVVFYKDKPYTYRLTGKQVVSAQAVSYLVPEAGQKRLILQTCWPPGSTTERLLIFADLIEEPTQEI